MKESAEKMCSEKDAERKGVDRPVSNAKTEGKFHSFNVFVFAFSGNRRTSSLQPEINASTNEVLGK